ncbi:MAG: ketopantoate reductase family protein [Proteobacteria bacterium]|nr:ketopantoate reductase family protein [Pseudomonadota bacterium]
MNQKGQELKIAVIGAGAIGGICAGFIKQAGFDVQVVVRREDHARQILEEGIHITGIKGEFTVKLDAVAGVEKMDPDRDVVLLGVKATAMEEVAQKLVLRLKPSAMVVSLQNGFCEQALADILGRDRVIGCVTGWGATLNGPCDLEMTSRGDFIVGNIDNKKDPRLEQVQGILNPVLPCLISENITGSLYSKLIINSCITSVGAVCGLYLGQMLARKQVRLIFLRIMEEAMAVAAAMDIQVEIFAGKLNYYTFLKEKGLFSTLKRHLFLRVLGFKYRRLKSSMLQSLERKQATEIDYLTGFITGNGKKYKIPTPVNDQIFARVRQIEKGQLAISPDNLDQIRI